MLANEAKRQSDALVAINMYNMIADLEDRIATGEIGIPEGLDMSAMQRAKGLSKSIISQNLNVQVI